MLPPVKERIVALALEAGFDLAGVATLDPPESGEAYLRWLERGDHAGMAYMARRVEARLAPASLLSGARWAVAVAWRYGPPAAEPAAGTLWSRTARYARGDDYHDAMLDRLAEVERRIGEEFPGSRTRRYVDTGPILERDLAARAGLGWVGKNTLLINRRLGSYFLLGEILIAGAAADALDRDAAGGQPAGPPPDLCGSCTRCLDACPTGAMPEPYRLDARRCISYWTIEHRGEFPADGGVDLHGWLFGCDICQEVCPWNRRPDPVERREFEVPPRRRDLSLTDLVEQSAEEYTERFRGSPLKRARIDGLRRNARAVLAAAAEAERG